MLNGFENCRTTQPVENEATIQHQLCREKSGDHRGGGGEVGVVDHVVGDAELFTTAVQGFDDLIDRAYVDGRHGENVVGADVLPVALVGEVCGGGVSIIADDEGGGGAELEIGQAVARDLADPIDLFSDLGGKAVLSGIIHAARGGGDALDADDVGFPRR